jgi:glucose-1-phosphate adenylyltransferase
MYAYAFDGYWRDVGTLLSLWESNMDLLGKTPGIDINDEYWKIFMNSKQTPPQYIARQLNVKNSIISKGCNIYGRVENSILCSDVTIAEGALVVDSILMPGGVIGKNAKVFKTFIGNDAILGEDASVGLDFGTNMYYDDKICSNGISLIGPEVSVLDNMKIAKNSHVAT